MPEHTNTSDEIPPPGRPAHCEFPCELPLRKITPPSGCPFTILGLAIGKPPFNVKAVDTAMRDSARRHPEGTPQDLPERQDHERLKDTVRFDANGTPRRSPFGLCSDRICS